MVNETDRVVERKNLLVMKTKMKTRTVRGSPGRLAPLLMRWHEGILHLPHKQHRPFIDPQNAQIEEDMGRHAPKTPPPLAISPLGTPRL